jgi:opacity protein-like surface antigen
MNRLAAALVFPIVAGFAQPAAAQDTPKAEVSAGYNWLAAKQSNDDEWTKFPKGWYFDVAGNVTETVSVVGQVTGNYRHFDEEDFDLNIHTFMAGVRGGSAGRIKGFGQFLVGGANLKASDDSDSQSETNFAIQLGGGVNVLQSGNVGLRLGLDYLRIFAKDDGVTISEDVNGLRFSVGVTFGVGFR